MILQVIMAFLATVAFAVIFNVPREQYLPCGLTGGAAWLCYLLALKLGAGVVLASFMATLLLTAVSRALAVCRRTPITLFLISGIFTLVPGAGIYYTAYYFIMDDNAQAVNKGIETFKIAVAIALGIVFVLSLPNSLFRLLRRKS